MECAASRRRARRSLSWTRLNEALRAAVADPTLVKQMTAVGVDLPSPDALQPATVTALIARGLEKDVPALKAQRRAIWTEG